MLSIHVSIVVTLSIHDSIVVMLSIHDSIIDMLSILDSKKRWQHAWSVHTLKGVTDLNATDHSRLAKDAKGN